jgi:hypothetical protein
MDLTSTRKRCIKSVVLLGIILISIRFISYLRQFQLQSFKPNPAAFCVQKSNRYTPKLRCSDNLKVLLLKPGLIELEQFYAAMKINHTEMKYTFNHFDIIKSTIYYNVTWVLEDNCIAFFVQEHWRSEMRHQDSVRGGSVFHTVVVGSRTIDFCPYVDHGNDTYTVFCPLYEQCVEVISHLQFFNYFPFWPKRDYERRSANLVAFKQKLCRPSNLNREFFPHLKQPYWIRNNVSKDISYDIEWSPSFEWHLQINETTSLPLMTNVTYKQCKNKISTLDFVGDSHMDIHKVYAMTLEDQVPNLYWQVGIISGMGGRLYDTQFVPSFTTIIRSRQRTATANKPAVIIADVGLHDLQFVSVPHFYQYVLPMLVGDLSQMQEEGLFRHVKLFLLGMTPMPPASHNHHRTASSAVITAMNRLMADKLAEARINLTFVEYFETARTFINKTSLPTDHHYINFNRTLLLVNKTFIYYGKVGIALGNYLINLVCS